MTTVLHESVLPVPMRRDRLAHRPIVCWVLTVVLIFGGIVRSNWATRLDSFTLDEAYHIMAGASYAGTGSFRINPEHPPLTKLWVGEVVRLNGYKLPPFKTLNDKREERRFAEESVYLTNDPVAVQRQARWAMFALNGLLLLLFTAMARQALGPTVALLTLAYLMIDPTVAAHLPVVMTDLPVALASGAAMLAAVRAFRSWHPIDLLLTMACLGLALAAKHSAIITVIGVGLLGVVLAFAGREPLGRRAGRLGMVAGVLIGAVVVLWGFYGFRYRDSPAEGEFFNRPLTTKIDDIQSPLSRTVLHGLADVHLLPASYLWGLADTFRAGVEGRPYPAFAFGKSYLNRAPFYYAPGIWGAKLPIGLLLLTLAGLVLHVLGKLPITSRLPVAALGLLAGLFWLALATGSTYGGVRHALSLLPLLAVLGALAVWYAFQHGIGYQLSASLAVCAALLTAIPVVRPWEYFNELAGGPANSYQYFNDEGVDLVQRSGELTQYYNRHLKPTGELPFIWYDMRRAEKQRYGLHWVGENPDRDSNRYQSTYVRGTFFLPSSGLSPNLYDVEDQVAVFRKARPVARMGNLLVYRGRFYLPNIRAMWLGNKGYKALFLDKKPDTTNAIRFMAAAMKLYPKSVFMDWELGNLYTRRNARAEAINAFTQARTYCVDPALKATLTAHIRKLQTADLRRMTTLRNPATE
ncbi:ArnT family glycosyltransferase [Spirosoma oryzae]|nr:phospholipid carrier-dependent glycosyltransferase [Spirosoma oryzae]